MKKPTLTAHKCLVFSIRSEKNMNKKLELAIVIAIVLVTAVVVGKTIFANSDRESSQKRI